MNLDFRIKGLIHGSNSSTPGVGFIEVIKMIPGNSMGIESIDFEGGSAA